MAVQEGAFPKVFAAVKEHTELIETVEGCLGSVIYLLQEQRADCVRPAIHRRMHGWPSQRLRRGEILL